MIVKDANDVASVTLRDGIHRKILIGKDESAPNFIMRLFEVEKGTEAKCHVHQWEHEIYVIEGRGAVIDPDGREIDVGQGSCVFIPSGQKHAMVNKGDESLKFLCLIPKVSDETDVRIVNCN